MSYFKITDLRVQYSGPSAVSVFVDGLDNGDKLGIFSPQRASAMLAVFNSGRDCYWDRGLTGTAKMFATDPTSTKQPRPKSELTSGVVASWEISFAEGVNAVVDVALLSATEKRTSGNAASGWARMTILDADLPAVVELLQSKYVFCDQDGHLRNTDINEDF